MDMVIPLGIPRSQELDAYYRHTYTKICGPWVLDPYHPGKGFDQ